MAMDAEMPATLCIDKPIDDIRIRFCREPLVRSGWKDSKLDAL